MSKEIITARNPNDVGAWGAGVQGRAYQDVVAWRPPLREADSDHAMDAGVMRARAREVSWQEPYGVNALRISRDSIVGKKYALSLNIDAIGLGISPEAAHEWEQLAEKEWERYAEGVWFGSDAARKNTWTFMMHQVLAGLQMDGEALGVCVVKRGWEGYMTALQLVEPERLVDPTEATLPPGSEIRHGVEIDRMGEPVAYYVRRSYPTSRWGNHSNAQAMDYERVPRMTEWGRYVVLHCYDEHRPNMNRGISSMISVLKQMKMLGHYSDTELERAIMAASFAATIESDIDYEQAMRIIGADGTGSWGNNLTAASMEHLKAVAPYHQALGLRFNGARIPHLLPGEKLNVVNSAVQGAEFDKFEQSMVRQLAAGLGVASESLSRDFSDTSYSAARMSLADIWRTFLVRREMMNQKFAMPYVAGWMEESILSGFLPLPDGAEPTLENWIARRDRLVRGTFISWGKPVIDPVKERQGQQMSLALGLTTMEEEAAAEGKDWDAILRQRKKEKDLREELGLNVLDIDPTLSYGPLGAGQKDPSNPNSEGRTSADGAE